MKDVTYTNYELNVIVARQRDEIATQAEEIARLKALLAARPTAIQLHAATANSAHWLAKFEEADAARKTAELALVAERQNVARLFKSRRQLKAEYEDMIGFIEQKHAEVS